MKLLGWIIVAACFGGVAFGQNDGRSTAHIFPQVANGSFRDGSYYRSALHITNPSSTASGTCAVGFHGMTTALQDVEGGLLTAGVFSITLTGNSWGVFRTGGTSPYQSGYATVSCTIPVNAVLIYGYYATNGAKLSEAAVFSSAPGTLLQVISDQRDGARMAMAITNDTDFLAVITISASNTQGQEIGNATITLPGRSQSVRFLDELLAGLLREHLGQVIVRSSGPPLAVIAFRYTGPVFTTIPSSVRQSPVIALPTITSITPSTAGAGSTAAVAISGANFVNGATAVSVSGSGIGVSGIQVVSATSVTAVFAISAAAAAGTRKITISTPGGTSRAIDFSVSVDATTKPFNQAQTERLMGTWLFSYSVGAVSLAQTYRLSDVQADSSAPGEWVILGSDQFGELVIGGYSPGLATFALLDTSSTIDRLFAFNFTGTNTVGGCYYEMPTGTLSLSSCYGMTGTRTTGSALAEGPAPSNADRQTGSTSEAPAGALIELLETLRNKAIRH